MKIHVHESEIGPQAGGLLIGKDNGATSGFCMGVVLCLHRIRQARHP
jgi:hypothetical protein